jgi:CheY-like chemotaxis protein
VSDGPEALIEMARHIPALVLIDACLASMADYKTPQHIRQLEAQHALPRIPIIALSATFDDASLKRHIDNGMDGVLKKPPHIDSLQSLVEIWLGQATSHANEQGSLVASAKDIYTLSRASIDEDIRAFEQAMEQRNAEAMAYFAHRLKGVGLMLRAKQAADLADRLEQAARAETLLKPMPLRQTLLALRNAIDVYFEYGDSAR